MIIYKQFYIFLVILFFDSVIILVIQFNGLNYLSFICIICLNNLFMIISMLFCFIMILFLNSTLIKVNLVDFI